jgi:hypothetical protein
MVRVSTVDMDLAWSDSWPGCVVDLRSGSVLSTRDLRAAARHKVGLG